MLIASPTTLNNYAQKKPKTNLLYLVSLYQRTLLTEKTLIGESANHISDKRLISRAYFFLKVIQLKDTHTHTQIKNWSRRNKYMKGCSVSLIIREMKTKRKM